MGGLLGLTCGVVCVGAGSGSVEGLEPFFHIAFGSDIFRFGVDFGRVGEAKMDPKIDFLEFFFDVFFESVFSIDFL